MKSGTVFLATTSKALKSWNAKQAHKVNPVDINVGVFRDGSYYSPARKEIQISLSASAVGLMRDFDYSLDVIKYISLKILLILWK